MSHTRSSEPPSIVHDGLVADIGGTNVRFGLAAEERLEQVRAFRCAEFATLTAAARTYLERAGAEMPRRAAFAIAGPVQHDRVQMTNHPWSFSVDEVRRDLGLDRLELLNDFAALALSVPALGDEDLRTIQTGTPRRRAPIAVLGPGTGLGVAALVPAGDGWTALATEGGHRDLAAASEREWRIVRHLAEIYGHVSVERVLSGPGQVNLYRAVSTLAGIEPRELTPEAVGQAARAAVSSGTRSRGSPDPVTEEEACVEALALFSGWLGAVAGDLALTLGARGGVYLGGGILGKLGEAFDVDRFRRRFVAKGRFEGYVREIPVYVITRPDAALLGAARALR